MRHLRSPLRGDPEVLRCARHRMPEVQGRGAQAVLVAGDPVQGLGLLHHRLREEERHAGAGSSSKGEGSGDKPAGNSEHRARPRPRPTSGAKSDSSSAARATAPPSPPRPPRRRRPGPAYSPALSTQFCLRCLLEERPQVRGQVVAQVPSLHREVHRRLEETEHRARVVPHALDLTGVDRSLAQQLAQPARQLDLAGAILADAGEHAEDVRRQHVPAHDRQVRWRLFARRLLDEIGDAVDAVAERFGTDDAVAADLIERHAFDGEHGALDLIEDVDHLADGRRRRVDDIVAEDDGEGLVADQVTRDADRVSEPERRPWRTAPSRASEET